MADEHPLFIGVPDTIIDEKNDQLCSWDTNKFGGYPNWMIYPDIFPVCALCNKNLHLVAQVYCPLDHCQYHRTLYIFGCISPMCWNDSRSWFVVRSQVPSTYNDKLRAASQDKQASEKFAPVDDWCDDAEDWGDDEENVDTDVLELESQTSKMNLNQDKISEEPPTFDKIALPPNYITTPHFTPYYINVFEDSNSYKQITNTGLTAHEKELIQIYQQQEGKELKDILSTKTQGHCAENYESGSVAHGNYGFHKFLKCVQSCPQQCIRYQWNGMPLSISDVKPREIMSTVAPCQYCGAHRVYELQLMPALVPLLQSNKSPGNESPSNITALPSTDVKNNYTLFGNDSGSHGNDLSHDFEKQNDSSLAQKDIKCEVNNEDFSYTYVEKGSSLDNTNDRVPPYKDRDAPKQSSLVNDNFRVTPNRDKQFSLAENTAETHLSVKEFSDTESTEIYEGTSERSTDIKQLKHDILNVEEGRIEFGTVIVFSCSQSCWESENGSLLKQEFVVVQADPDADLFSSKV